MALSKVSWKSFIENNTEEITGQEVPIRRLKLSHVYSCKDSMTRILRFGEPSGLRERQEKTLMLVGSTGAGKSTLIDSMVNYLMGIERHNNYRYRIINKIEEQGSKSDTQSQTEWITLYKLYVTDPDRTNAIINIIDTPGFGDTRGIDRDKKLVEQITQFFSHRDKFGVQSLDVVCFVAKASETRLTVTHKYICSSVLAVFGKDIANNILAAITFYDGSEAQNLIKALKISDVPFSGHFYFNNSAIFKSPTDSNAITTMFWKVMMDSFDDFFSAIDRMQPTSLIQTAEVLAERRKLEMITEGLVYRMESCLQYVHNLDKEEEALKEDRKDMRQNRVFEYEAKEYRYEEKELKKKFATNCPECQMTCHRFCTINKNSRLNKCDSIASKKSKTQKAGTCLVCPKHCMWNIHESSKKEIIRLEVTVTKTDEDLKAKYTQLRKDVRARKDVVEQLKRDVQTALDEIRKLTNGMRECKERLGEIALKPNPMTEVEFIEFLIAQEMSEAQEGFLDRVNALEKVKQQTIAYNCTTVLEKLKLN